MFLIMRSSSPYSSDAEVTAESLYEAVALGLRAIRQCIWVEDIGQNFTIRVLARDTPVEHTVEFRAFHKWLEQPARSPRELTATGLRPVLFCRMAPSNVKLLDRTGAPFTLKLVPVLFRWFLSWLTPGL